MAEFRLIEGNPLKPEDGDLILVEDYRDAGDPVPAGFNVVNSTNSYNWIMGVFKRSQIDDLEPRVVI